MFGELCCYTVLYILLCFIIIFPPDEIAAMGLTVEKVLGSWFGSELLAFVQYHQRRTSATLVIHSLLIPGYLVLLNNTEPWVWSWLSSQHRSAVPCVVLLSISPVLVAVCAVAWWQRDNWRRHPLSNCLKLFVADPQTDQPDAWATIAKDINIQYRSVDKLSTYTSSTVQLVATDSWLIQMGSYSVTVMPLADTLVVLEGAISNTLDTRTVAAGNSQRAVGAGNPQLLKIRARCVTKKSVDITFRLSSALMSELERKLVIPVHNAGQVVVRKSLADEFHEVFMTTISQNPVISDLGQDGASDPCIGCMAQRANVKLDRRCKRIKVVGGSAGEPCSPCSCRPLWCITCMSKWFAARQDQEHPETWLSSRAPCPTCRSLFCLLDVRLIATGQPLQ